MKTEHMMVVPLQVAATVVIGSVVWGGLLASLYAPLVWGRSPGIPTITTKKRDNVLVFPTSVESGAENRGFVSTGMGQRPTIDDDQ